MFQEWMKEIDEEQFPEPYKTIAKEAGKEAMLKIAARYQGTGMYFPKLDSLIQEIRNQRIREEFTGTNHNELAIKYNLTASWIRTIVAPKADPNQQNIYQFLDPAL